MACICGTVLVVVARLRAAAVLRLSWSWAMSSVGMLPRKQCPLWRAIYGFRSSLYRVICPWPGLTPCSPRPSLEKGPWGGEHGSPCGSAEREVVRVDVALAVPAVHEHRHRAVR